MTGENLTRKTLYYADVVVYLTENFTTIRTMREEVTIPEHYSIIWPEPTESKSAKYITEPGKTRLLRLLYTYTLSNLITH